MYPYSLLACSSAVEQATVNRPVVGSIPTMPAISCLPKNLILGFSYACLFYREPLMRGYTHDVALLGRCSCTTGNATP